jgi:hypothetical protein
MPSRLELQTLLENVLGSRNVYYQPPESVKMRYPAIVYSRSSIDNVHANDSVYKQNYAYEIVVIYDDPDSDLPAKMSKLPMCRFDRGYVADNLYHDSFTMYY